MCLPVLPSLSPSSLESYRHLSIFLGADDKDQMDNVFPRSWNTALLMMLSAVLAGLCNKAPGLLETSALSHNLECALLR